jgi:hypothetical protein
MSHATSSVRRFSAVAPRESIRKGRLRKAFSTIELPQLGMVIGIFAAFVGLPHLLRSDEQGKSLEAFRYLADVQEAQQEYLAVHGTFANDIDQLDLRQYAPTYFSVGSFADVDKDQAADRWTLTLTRSGGRAGGYGAYTVTFTQHGFDPAHSKIASELCPPGRWIETP